MLTAALCASVAAGVCPLSTSELRGGDFLSHRAATAADHLLNCTQYRAATCCTAQDALHSAAGYCVHCL